MASPNPNHVVKKKRNPPGNPDPNAEVIALSPNTLLATNRFVCEICNKGFQRDQNLQLHRRGHNLPWKLKQRSSKETTKKVYVCPEVTCMHHDPSRALGDLTGIKKHFSRKHGEKKWKCERCSKKYAVHADWKAHAKTCGTREYRCDCGTLFSRRDSFITHRAFCDALTEETTRGKNQALGDSYLSTISASNQAFADLQNSESLIHLNSLPSLPHTPSFLYPQTFHPSTHMSATALLQKAAEMASKASRDSSASFLGFDLGHQNPSYLQETVASFGDEMTRDFLNQRAISQGDILSMAGFAPSMSSSSSYEHLRQSKNPWNGVSDFSS